MYITYEGGWGAWVPESLPPLHDRPGERSPE